MKDYEGGVKKYGFSRTIAHWKKIEEAHVPDHFDVSTVLKEFNDMVACAGDQWNIHREECAKPTEAC